MGDEPFESPFLLVLDTNVLLGAHQQSVYTFDTLKLMLRKHYENIWIPRHVWDEYLVNCESIYQKYLNKSKENYEASIKDLDKVILRGSNNKAIEFSQEDTTTIKKAKIQILDLYKKYYTNERKRYSKTQNQSIKNKITGWLNSKIGEPLPTFAARN